MASSKIPIAIALAGVVVAWALYSSMGGSFSFEWPWQQQSAHPSAVRPVSPEDHILGNPAASVIIVTYCDFESPYCKTFAQTANELVATAGVGGEVAWVHREFPLHEDTGNALADARAAECAAKVGGNDGFWAFADALYEYQPATPSDYGALSKIANLPEKAFADCYADAIAQVGERIKADRKNALAVGADGAPFSILITNDKALQAIDGAYPYDQLRQVVDEALGASQ